MKLPEHCRALCAAAVLIACVTTSAAGQYFGRNKVKYEDFDFKVLETEHFDIYFYPGERPVVERAAVMAEAWYQRLSTIFDHELSGRQPLILYGSHPHFEQTTAIRGTIGEATGGVTEARGRRMVLPLASSMDETNHVIGHELVHAFQFDMSAMSARGGTSVPVALTFPLWFVEGMAEYLSLGPTDAHTVTWMRDAVANDRLPDVSELSDPEYFPYRFGHAMWSYLAGRWGVDAVSLTLNAAGGSGNWRGALERTLGIPLDTLTAEWHADLRYVYGDAVERARDPSSYGPRVISEETHGGEVNVAPSLSPDGSRLVFLSEKDLFSIELYVADAQTGEVIRKLTETAVDPHFESLQFIQSAGSWSPGGDRFVFAGVVKGQPVLTIIDPSTGNRDREIRIPRLGEIFDPSWSPDGDRIAFSALHGGQSDLFIYDLEADSLVRLTSDLDADMQPEWLGDGESLVFVTDRFGADSVGTTYGQYRLARIDVNTGQLDPLPSLGWGKHVSPQYLASENSVVFVSDHSGTSDLYRLDLTTGQFRRLTEVPTGITGITALSPAVTVARDAPVAVYSVFQSGNYNLFRIDDQSTLAGQPLRRDPLRVTQHLLPPVQRNDQSLVSLLRQSPEQLARTDTGAATDSIEDYSPTLQLEGVAPPTFVVGSSSFGTFVGGGTALFFRDLLGTHELTTALQINGGLEDVMAEVGYLNRGDRWNWGAQVSRTPFITGSYGRELDEINGDSVLVEQFVRLRQTNLGGSLVTAYPFDRARRVEFRAGFTNVTFDRELQRRAFDLNTGEEVIDETEDLGAPDGLNLVQAGAAFVYDQSFFGASAPILGSRYRLDVSGTTGSLSFLTGTIDLRRYFMPVEPFTFAARVMHVGRYGPDANDNVLTPLFLGYGNTVRGYNVSSFGADECVPSGGASCPAFDQLFGSRMIVANAEVRFPIIGLLNPNGGFYGGFPLDAVAFVDAGLAWRDDRPETETDERAFFLGGDREPVTSAGFGLRTAVGGLLILELDLVHPFDRPAQGWYVQFNFTPGF